MGIRLYTSIGQEKRESKDTAMYIPARLDQEPTEYLIWPTEYFSYFRLPQEELIIVVFPSVT